MLKMFKDYWNDVYLPSVRWLKKYWVLYLILNIVFGILWVGGCMLYAKRQERKLDDEFQERVRES